MGQERKAHLGVLVFLSVAASITAAAVATRGGIGVVLSSVDMLSDDGSYNKRKKMLQALVVAVWLLR